MSDTYFLITGIILAVIGIGGFAVQIMHRASCSMKVTAVVVSVQKKKSGYWRGKTFYQYFPTFSYLVQGESHKVKCTYPIKRAKTYTKDDEVVIRYNPKAPEVIYTGASFISYIVYSLLITFGVVLIVCYFI